MNKKEKNWYVKDEANTTAGGSVVGDLKGAQMPLGAKGRKKINPSSPFGDEKLKKEQRTKLQSDLAEEVEETIEKQGDKWVIVDPTTGVSRGTATSRDDARKKQDNMGLGVRRKTPGQSALPQRSVDLHGKAKTGTKKKKSSKPSRGHAPVEHIKVLMRNKLKECGLKASQIKESNAVSKMFEKNSIWESFLEGIPRDAVMEDVGLSEAVKIMAEAEARVLARSVLEIKKVLESTGAFVVERKSADLDPDSGNTRMPFVVNMGEGVQPLLFAVKLEGGRPSILFPESSRELLNNALTKESKFLRTELMRVQESVLDKFEEVLEAARNRDVYLTTVESRLNEMLSGLSLVETSIVDNLVKNKLKGVK